MTPNNTGEVASSIPKGVLGISLALSSFIVVANLLLALGIALDRHLRSPPAGCFFLSLLLAGLLTGLALPMLPGLWSRSHRGYWSCLFLHLAPNFSFLSLLANLLLVHGERYVAVLQPLRPHGSMRLALLLTWASPMLFASLPALGWNHWSPGANCSSKLSSQPPTSTSKSTGSFCLLWELLPFCLSECWLLPTASCRISADWSGQCAVILPQPWPGLSPGGRLGRRQEPRCSFCCVGDPMWPHCSCQCWPMSGVHH